MSADIQADATEALCSLVGARCIALTPATGRLLWACCPDLVLLLSRPPESCQLAAAELLQPLLQPILRLLLPGVQQLANPGAVAQLARALSSRQPQVLLVSTRLLDAVAVRACNGRVMLGVAGLMPQLLGLLDESCAPAEALRSGAACMSRLLGHEPAAAKRALAAVPDAIGRLQAAASRPGPAQHLCCSNLEEFLE